MTVEDIRTTPNKNELWYKDAVFYAVDVESFQDSDGDGVGDFQGLIDRLDYLRDLGVDCIWILPFYSTPNRDNGYDVKDYMSVDGRLGTLHDFSQFVRAAKQRRMRVLVDLIVHHTSNEHPWFQAASADPTSKFFNYYVWRKDRPSEASAQNVFPGQENSVWSYEKSAGAYYHHKFYSFQPDLNIANPDVQHEIMSIIDFWLAFGVDGFRIDAATHLLDGKDKEGTRVKKPAQFLQELRDTITQKSEETVLLGEADVPQDKISLYFGKGERINMLFNFILDNYIFLGLAREDAQSIASWLKEPLPPVQCQWVNFLRNLDELDLERLSEGERQEVFKRFAPDENMRIFNRGIRRRLAPMLGGDRKHIEMAYSLMFTMPGSPMLVYGDEIGMGEDLKQQGRGSVRLPMQWNAGQNGGFSTAPSDKVVWPMLDSGPFSYKKVNVVEQHKDEDSLLSWMKRLIQMRKHCKEIGWGEANAIPTDTPQVLLHTVEWDESMLVFAHNLSGEPCEAEVQSKDIHPRQFVDFFSDELYEPTKEDTTHVKLNGYGYRWFRVNQPKTL
ncbi:maltose alpha-D-glucosyltransferase/alpha-amylase [Pontibacter ummariensis]|uniref:Maltose alpha-D-glucosyltransferase/ alpha-amylase n=1 Tax=Pontibacter ummariensis TaxID=1610492 RepID=A0A239C200_9BACT|nr:alpha-amylase family protein [Pontibacter ummariensis]PRY15526.1 maltose alpha-D-glucosyltransferase/alpha-amylase [Pontibacter ummariensis]SNS13403.1 maltose alpha-D-glucosyltransferase/ alpha-amylase [Pontibacter ummariensis]